MSKIELKYSELCGKCRKLFLYRNKKRIEKLIERFSYSDVSKITGVPSSTLFNLVNDSFPKLTSKKSRKYNHDTDNDIIDNF